MENQMTLTVKPATQKRVIIIEKNTVREVRAAYQPACFNVNQAVNQPLKFFGTAAYQPARFVGSAVYKPAVFAGNAMSRQALLSGAMDGQSALSTAVASYRASHGGVTVQIYKAASFNVLCKERNRSFIVYAVA
ncbi:MAG: hypothetical protein LBT30_05735 [Clostridiales bacterium]|nr:hypothetical protein [Clostridiales bacterium]